MTETITCKSYLTGKNVKKWRFRFQIADINGKRQFIHKHGFATKAEAMEAAKKAQQEYFNFGKKEAKKSISVSDLYSVWLDEVCKNKVRATTLEGYKKKIRNYIIPYLGHYYVRSIDTPLLNKYLSDMFDQGFSPQTLTCIRGLLSSCFRFAYQERYIDTNPAESLTIPRNRNPETETRTHPHIYIDEESWKKILERFPRGSSAYLPLVIAYHTGLRLGEVFGLCWEDINFESREISVCHQIQCKDGVDKDDSKNEGKWFFAPTKNKKNRVITMSDSLADILFEEMSRQLENQSYLGPEYIRYYTDRPLNHDPNDTGKVDFNNPVKTIGQYPVHFVNVRDNGEYISPRIMQHTSAVIHRDILPGFTFHSLRHTNCSLLIGNDCEPKYVAERLGHSSTKITMDIYTHLTPNKTVENNKKMNEIFDAQK